MGPVLWPSGLIDEGEGSPGWIGLPLNSCSALKGKWDLGKEGFPSYIQISFRGKVKSILSKRQSHFLLLVDFLRSADSFKAS